MRGTRRGYGGGDVLLSWLCFFNRILSEFHKLYWPLPQEKRWKKCHKRYCARPATDPPTIPGQWLIISNLLFSIKSPSITTENDNNVKAIADTIFIVGVKNHWRTAQTMSWRGDGSVWGARVRWNEEWEMIMRKLLWMKDGFGPAWRAHIWRCLSRLSSWWWWWRERWGKASLIQPSQRISVIFPRFVETSNWKPVNDGFFESSCLSERLHHVESSSKASSCKWLISCVPQNGRGKVPVCLRIVQRASKQEDVEKPEWKSKNSSFIIVVTLGPQIKGCTTNVCCGICPQQTRILIVITVEFPGNFNKSMKFNEIYPPQTSPITKKILQFWFIWWFGWLLRSDDVNSEMPQAKIINEMKMNDDEMWRVTYTEWDVDTCDACLFPTTDCCDVQLSTVWQMAKCWDTIKICRILLFGKRNGTVSIDVRQWTSGKGKSCFAPIVECRPQWRSSTM